MVKIITDSTCNLDDELLARHDIRVAPIAIQFGEETFEENIDLDREAFYARIERTGRIPTTSQPSPSWFERFYREVHAQGDQSLVITVTAKHSGTYQSAVLAKAMAPQASVEVFDSASISLGTGWMVIEAARASERGQPLASILDRLDHIRRHMQLVITPATLKYLRMSGRVGKLQGALASLLDVKPVIAVRDGLLEAGERVRTRGKARSGGLVGGAWRAGNRRAGRVSGLRPRSSVTGGGQSAERRSSFRPVRRRALGLVGEAHLQCGSVGGNLASPASDGSGPTPATAWAPDQGTFHLTPRQHAG